MRAISEHFCIKFQKCDRAIQNYIKKAKEYNSERIKAGEEIKSKIFAEETEKSFRINLLSRNGCLEILSKIANKSTDERTKIAAIQQLAKMEGWESVAKTEITGKDGAALVPEPINIIIIDKREQIEQYTDHKDIQ
jgi:hypothetical protein